MLKGVLGILNVDVYWNSQEILNVDVYWYSREILNVDVY